MNIYTHTCIDRTPYTYYIEWSNLNKKYYGRRTAKNCHPSEFWKTYFTSSNYVKRFRTDHGEPDITIVDLIFESLESCKLYESWFHYENNVVRDDSWLNESYGCGKFDKTNKHTAICNLTNTNLGLVSCDDLRWKTGDIRSINVGSRMPLLSSNLTGSAPAIDLNTNSPIYNVPLSDLRWKTGEIVGLNYGKSAAICAKTGESLGCVSINDIRWETGEIISVNKNRVFAVPAKDKNGVLLGNILTSDPRWQTKEIQKVNTNSKAISGDNNPSKRPDVREKLKISALNREKVMCPYCHNFFSKHTISRHLNSTDKRSLKNCPDRPIMQQVLK